MKKYIFVLLTFSLYGCANLPPKFAATSNETFDFANAKSDDEIQELKSKLMDIAGSTKPLHLNWRFVFHRSSYDSFHCDSGVVSPGTLTDMPEGLDVSVERFDLPFHTTNSYHFGLSVIVGKENQYPLNAVTCNQSSDFTFVNVQGYYAGVVYDVPTAFKVELRPLSVYGATTSDAYRQLLSPPPEPNEE